MFTRASSSSLLHKPIGQPLYLSSFISSTTTNNPTAKMHFPTLLTNALFSTSPLRQQQQPLSNPPSVYDSSSCPKDSPLSCHNSTTYPNSCCFIHPGGQLLQTQFWDTNPTVGPSDSWTLHGLWYPLPIPILIPESKSKSIGYKLTRNPHTGPTSATVPTQPTAPPRHVTIISRV